MSNNSVRIQSKEQLAKLMATENIFVEHSNIPTAAFDVINRKLHLPLWKDISDEVYTLLISHEVGHALFTPTEEWKTEILEKKDDNLKAAVNIVEDVRIEKLIQNKYPGTVRSFRAGYSELEKKNIFGTVGKDISKYNLIDRLNIHFKVGHFGYAQVPFFDGEKQFLDKIANCKSFQDVLRVSKELIEYVENHKESQGEGQDQEQSQEKKVGIATDDHSQADPNAKAEDFDEIIISEELVKKLAQKDEIKDGEENKDGKSDDNSSDKNSSSTKQEQDSENNKGGQGSDSGQNLKQPKIIISKTQEHFNQSLEKMIDNKTKIIYVNLPHTKLEAIVVPYKKVLQQFRDYYFDKDDLYFAESVLETFKANSRNMVNQLANLFEMKKKARQDARSLTAKTGILDINRVYSYRYNEDIFKKITLVPNGKSHGLVMFIDLSSSMSSNIRGTLEQVMNLVLFCKKVSIPFDVYGFTDKEIGRKDLPKHPVVKGELMYLDRFSLRHYFSNRMSGVEFNEAIRNFLAMVHYYEGKTIVGPKGIPTYPHIPYSEYLGGTPLNDAILAGIELVNKFRAENRLDVVNTIFLTDGEDSYGLRIPDDDTSNTNYHYSYFSQEDVVVRDLKTRKQWKTDEYNRYDTTSFLLEIFRELTGSKAIGFYIVDKCGAKWRIQRLIKDIKKQEEAILSYKKDRYAELKNVAGYSFYYIIPGGESLCVEGEEFDVDIDTTTDWDDEKQAKKAMKSLTKEFCKHMKDKVVSRILLNRFIEHISE